MFSPSSMVEASRTHVSTDEKNDNRNLAVQQLANGALNLFNADIVRVRSVQEIL